MAVCEWSWLESCSCWFMRTSFSSNAMFVFASILASPPQNKDSPMRVCIVFLAIFCSHSMARTYTKAAVQWGSTTRSCRASMLDTTIAKVVTIQTWHFLQVTWRRWRSAQVLLLQLWPTVQVSSILRIWWHTSSSPRPSFIIHSMQLYRSPSSGVWFEVIQHRDWFDWVFLTSRLIGWLAL